MGTITLNGWVVRVLLLTCWVVVLPSWAADKPLLDPNLEPLRPFLGKTWKGEFKNSTPEKPVVDVAVWERALNGKAVRILHSINNGAYGGESIVTWDAKRQAVTYHYFTTAGFMTTGTMSIAEGKVTTHEIVSGSGEGITEVRGITELRPDGTFRVTTEYLKNGEWTPGRDVVYREDPSAKVEFR
jgi:hypothetical protein